jgi:hypothetical protein
MVVLIMSSANKQSNKPKQVQGNRKQEEIDYDAFFDYLMFIKKTFAYMLYRINTIRVD